MVGHKSGVKFRSSPYRLAGWPIDSFLVGTWLSLVEHSLGVRGVGSSNLPVPTKFSASIGCIRFKWRRENYSRPSPQCPLLHDSPPPKAPFPLGGIHGLTIIPYFCNYRSMRRGRELDKVIKYADMFSA